MTDLVCKCIARLILIRSLTHQFGSAANVLGSSCDHVCAIAVLFVVSNKYLAHVDAFCGNESALEKHLRCHDSDAPMSSVVAMKIAHVACAMGDTGDSFQCVIYIHVRCHENYFARVRVRCIIWTCTPITCSKIFTEESKLTNWTMSPICTRTVFRTCCTWCCHAMVRR